MHFPMFHLLKKVQIAHRVYRNWPHVLLDRLGLLQNIDYRLRNGGRMRCRGGTSDSGEVAVVCAGVEYPANRIVGLRDLPGAVVFDLGANIGAFSVWTHFLLNGADYRGYAFEPLPENADLLRFNLMANGVHNFSVVQSCVAGIDGRVCLDTDRDYDSVRISSPGPGMLEVPSIRLSTFARDIGVSRIDLLKMDIEGAEFDVIEKDLEFFEGTVQNFFIEVHEEVGGRNTSWLKTALERSFELSTAGLRQNILVGSARR
jgi:FkbM family methyltransferase